MNWLQGPELKVGLLVVIVGGLIGFMSMQVSDDPGFMSRSHRAWFLIENAGGLVKNSAIKTAGIPVGVIRDISLQDGKARIDVTVTDDVKLTSSATIFIKSQGILGDKHIEVDPGSPTDPPLPDSAQILTVSDAGSLDNLIGKVSEVATSLKDVMERVREAVSDSGNERHVLGRIMLNVEKLTGDIAEITGKNKEQVHGIVKELREITSTVSEVLKDESEEGFRKSWKKLMASFHKLDSTMTNVDQIAAKINNGEGAIGKLVSDEQTAEDVEGAISGLNSLVDSAGKISTAFDFHSEYLNEIGKAKASIGVQIIPGLDRYYEIALIDDPAGVVENVDTELTTRGTTSELSERRTYYNKTKLSAIFAKNFWDLTVRGGLIENTGGIGLDYKMLRKKLKFSFEAFDFTRTNLRTTVSYKLPYGVYLTGGVSDILDKSQTRSGFVGAGLYLTNDDLKLLLTKSPF